LGEALPDPLASPRLLWACAIVVAIGLARIVWVQVGEGHLAFARPPSVEEPYRRLAPELPADARLGYLSTDAEPNPFADERYVHATYSLAPRAVVRGTEGVRHVVLTFDDARGLRELCRAHRLVPIAVDPAGVAVARVER
jgi:hypothetical protein